MKKHLIILRGLPGSGKTTVAEILSNIGFTSDDIFNFKATICTADDFFMDGDEYKFDPNKLGIAHKTCKDKCENAMLNNEKRVIVGNTSTTEKEIKPYFKLAQKYGYMVISLIVENRHGGKNTHNVPDKAIEKMENRFAIKLK